MHEPLHALALEALRAVEWAPDPDHDGAACPNCHGHRPSPNGCECSDSVNCWDCDACNGAQHACECGACEPVPCDCCDACEAGAACTEPQPNDYDRGHADGCIVDRAIKALEGEAGPKCKIQWIDKNGKLTTDSNPAVGMCWTPARRQLIAGRMIEFSESEHFPICQEHAMQLSDPGMEIWTFEPFDLEGKELTALREHCARRRRNAMQGGGK